MQDNISNALSRWNYDELMMERRDQEDLESSFKQKTGKLKKYQVLSTFVNQPSSSQLIYEEKKLTKKEIF